MRHIDDPNWIGNTLSSEECTPEQFNQILSDMVEDGIVEIAGMSSEGELLFSLPTQPN